MNEPQAAAQAEDPNVVTSLDELDALLEREALNEDDSKDLAESGTDAPAKEEKTAEKEAKDDDEKSKDEAKKDDDESEDDKSSGKFRRALVAREKVLVERQSEFTQRVKAHEAREAQFQRDVSSYIEERDLGRKDPVGWLRRVHGWSDEKIATQLLDAKNTPPQRDDDTAEARIAKLERERKEEREQLARERAQMTEAQRLESAKKLFAATVASDEDKWPLLAASYTPEEIGEKAVALYQRAVNHSIQLQKARGAVEPQIPQYTDIQIADALEKEERLREERREERRKAKAGAKTGAQESGSAKTKESASTKATKGEAESRNSVPTLTGRSASEKSPTTTVDTLSLSEEEADELALSAARDARNRR